MQDIIMVGAGGCMREIVWQMQEQNKHTPTWNVLGYVDAVEPVQGEYTVVGDMVIPYLGDDDYLLARTTETNVAVCVGSPQLRKKIADKLVQNRHIYFPNIMLGNVLICGDIRLGKGCIVSMDVRISANVRLGDFVFLNSGSKICHDGTIGDFTTLSPDVTLAGDVSVGVECDLGLGTKVIQGIRIGSGAVTGAGSVIVADVEKNTTVVGVPARKIRGS